MKDVKKIYWVCFLSGLLGILILDLVSKCLAVAGVINDHTIIRGFIYFTAFQKNEGIAFGINLPMWIQIIGSVCILYLLMRFGFDCIFMDKRPSFFKLTLLGVIVGGGFGNLLGRVINGYVVDFIVIRPLPVFNVADIGITVGIILFFGTMMLSGKKTKN